MTHKSEGILDVIGLVLFSYYCSFFKCHAGYADPFLNKNDNLKSLYFTVTDQEKSLKELRKDDEFHIFPHVFPLLGFIYGFE